jgi:CheY-like chemotaxis protein
MNRFVLMLEGDGDDRYITEQTLSELDISVSMQFSSNSAEFFTFLSEERKPALILINYNSVPENGIQVLKRLKENPNYNDIPVVILSDSNLDKYRNECYRYGASSFIKKPDTAKATNQKIASFFNYWFNVVEV